MRELTLQEEYRSAKAELDKRVSELRAAESYMRQARERFERVADRVVEKYLPKPGQQ